MAGRGLIFVGTFAWLRRVDSLRNLHAVDASPLWEQWTRERCLRARESLILAYIPLVHRIAGRMHRIIPPQVSLEDLRAWGTMGLIRAVEHYDPGSGAACGGCGRCGSSRGTSFETYAANAIRGVILDEIRSQDWAPRRVRKRQRTMEGARAELEGALGRAVVEVEMAVVLGWDEREVAVARMETEQARTRSLDEPNAEDESRSTWVPDPSADVFTAVSGSVLLRGLVEAVLALPVQQQILLSLVYYDGANLSEAADRMGITVQRAKELHALATMGVHSRARELVGAEGT